MILNSDIPEKKFIDFHSVLPIKAYNGACSPSLPSATFAFILMSMSVL